MEAKPEPWIHLLEPESGQMEHLRKTVSAYANAKFANLLHHTVCGKFLLSFLYRKCVFIKEIFVGKKMVRVRWNILHMIFNAPDLIKFKVEIRLWWGRADVAHLTGFFWILKKCQNLCLFFKWIMSCVSNSLRMRLTTWK